MPVSPVEERRLREVLSYALEQLANAIQSAARGDVEDVGYYAHLVDLKIENYKGKREASR